MLIDVTREKEESIMCRHPVTPSENATQYLCNRNGPTHGEVKWFQQEPVLVEVGARCHGGDGLWLALGDECFGCNQAKCAIDSYLFPNVYAMMQDAVSDFIYFPLRLFAITI